MKKYISVEKQIYFEEVVVGPSMDIENRAVEDGITDECMIHCLLWKPCQAVLFHFYNYTDNMNCELLQLDVGDIEISLTTNSP